jgi:hypothetical protein
MSIAQLKRELTFRVTSLPVSRSYTIPFITLVVKWVECSGEEWTVDRLKSIKLDFIRLKSGLCPVSSWIKKGYKGSTFGGIIGALEKKALSSDKDFNSIIQVLQVYSFFISQSLTERQKSKFLDGVQATPPPRRALTTTHDILLRGYSLAGLRPVRFMPSPEPLVEYSPSPNRRAPLPGRSVPEVEGIIDSLHYLWFTIKGRAHYQKYKSYYDSVMTGLDWWNTWLKKATGPYGPMPNISPEFLVGRIGLIQEPGYKLRAVANPGRVFQQVLKPLGDTLYRTLKELPWDCTFNQSKATPVIQEQLSRGGVVHSIDLSGATDYFPLELQEFLLKRIFPTDIVDMFSEISQGTWEMPGIGQVSWRRGQPLGLYPSFGSFALTHGCLLLGLRGRYPFDNSFFVLGDDVVILDDELAHSYLSLMEELGCPISTSKSISSNRLCEFAGKIITEFSVIPQYKWRNVSDNSFIDICRNLGRQSMKLLRTRQRKVIERIAPLPECLGGFGWNPEGLPLETRLERCPWVFNDEKPRGRVTSYTGISIRTLFGSDSYRQTLKDQPNLVSSLRDDLDQRSIALTRSHISEHLAPWYRILGRNLDEVLTSKLLDCDLPIEATRDQSTLLHSMERLIGQDQIQGG